jgi:hypothetical protein
MDKFSNRLREDAAKIDAEISPELDERIRASLHNISPEAARPRPQPMRSHTFWLASTVTGVAAALALIAIINLDDDDVLPEVTADNAVQQIVFPELDLNAEAAMLTGPLSDELEKLQQDLRKAEAAVREDVRIDF